MKIIGHRGAAGLALENTLESIRLARELGVDRIEFDVRITKDGKVVVCHDATLTRVSDSTEAIQNLTYAELRKIHLRNGEHVPLLADALREAGTTPVIVEVKVISHTKEIYKVLDEFPKSDILIESFHPSVVADMLQLRPHIPRLLAENQHPFSFIHSARRLKSGVALNHRLLNPLNYWMAVYYKVQIMIYTVDNPLVVWYFKLFYPRVWICTNHPERFVPTTAVDTVSED